MGAGRLRSYANTAGRFSGTDRMQKAMATANSYLANSVASRSLAKDLTESIGPSIGDATAPEVIAVRRAVGTVESEVDRGSTFRVWLPAVFETEALIAV